MTGQTACAPSLSPATTVLPLLELKFVALPDRLKLVRPSIHAAALMAGFSDLTARDIVLAVDEACQNIIVHAYGRPEQPATHCEITLTISGLRDGVRITLHDRAAAVDPATIKPRDLAQIRPGGLGTHFIRQIMDHVDHVPGVDGTGNTLDLIKYHRPSQ